MSVFPGLFLPTTREIEIAPGIVYRPIRSWHAGTYAGERLRVHDGDRSGCIIREELGLELSQRPYTATHRLYWRRSAPEARVSAFLSYPSGMGSVGEYFWEALIGGEVERFMGATGEVDCEAAIVAHLSKAVQS